MSDDFDFCGLLRSRRLERRLTQANLANKCGMLAGEISKYETGTVSPRLNTLLRLIGGLEMTPAYFFSDTRMEWRLVAVGEAQTVEEGNVR